jgi:hypothetical protein
MINMALIGGGAYAIALFFAFALCRAAAPTNGRGIQARGCATKPAAAAPGASSPLAKAKMASKS